MTTTALGTVTQRTPQVASYTLNASAIRPTLTVVEALPIPSPAPTPPVFVTVDGVASSPDNPAMPPYRTRLLFSQSQNAAIKSAAQNTALAYGLNVTMSGDQAVKISNDTFQKALAAIPPVNQFTTTVVILPS